MYILFTPSPPCVYHIVPEFKSDLSTATAYNILMDEK